MTTFALAKSQDDQELRMLLQTNAMPSWVNMKITREPSYFAGMHRFGKDWAVIARQKGVPVGMYACSEHPVHINGNPTEIGYLHSLRIMPLFRGRIGILKGGFAALRSFTLSKNATVWYTAIASENRIARRLLEANLQRMPRYIGLNDFITFALSCTSRYRPKAYWNRVVPTDLNQLCSFYNYHARHYQLAPFLTQENALRSGATFYSVVRAGKIQASMALWNQQSYKQIVASTYRPPLQTLRPLYNLYARLRGKIALPPAGGVLDQTFLAFFAVAPSLEQQLPSLLKDACSLCQSKVLTFGLHAHNPLTTILYRHCRPTMYRTRIYAVTFDDQILMDERPAQPEAALL